MFTSSYNVFVASVLSKEEKLAWLPALKLALFSPKGLSLPVYTDGMPYLAYSRISWCLFSQSTSLCITAGKHCSSVCLQVSSAVGAWTVHWLILKVMMYILGIPSAVPFLELMAYAGYAFAPVCASMVAGMAFGECSRDLMNILIKICVCRGPLVMQFNAALETCSAFAIRKQGLSA